MFKLNPCCCFNIRTGAFLIGIFELISWTATFTATTITVAFSIAISNGFNQFHLPSNETNITQEEEFNTPQQSNSAGINSILLIACLTLSLSAIRIIAACVLLLGIQRDSTCMLISWISIKLLAFLLTLMSFIGSALFMRSKYEPHHYEEIYGEENSNAFATSNDGIMAMNVTNNGHIMELNSQSQQSYSTIKPQLGNVLMLFINFIISTYFIWVIICLVKDIKAKQIATPEFNVKKV